MTKLSNSTPPMPKPTTIGVSLTGTSRSTRRHWPTMTAPSNLILTMPWPTTTEATLTVTSRSTRRHWLTMTAPSNSIPTTLSLRTIERRYIACSREGSRKASQGEKSYYFIDSNATQAIESLYAWIEAELGSRIQADVIRSSHLNHKREIFL